MKIICDNCKSEFSKKKKNIDSKNIKTKYDNYYLCLGCNESLLLFGFLGDVNNPTIIYKKPEKININLKNLNKVHKKKKINTCKN